MSITLAKTPDLLLPSSTPAPVVSLTKAGRVFLADRVAGPTYNGVTFDFVQLTEVGVSAWGESFLLVRDAKVEADYVAAIRSAGYTICTTVAGGWIVREVTV